MDYSKYFVVLAPNDIRLKGHRIGIETILYEYLHRGQTAEMIAAEYETLTLDEINATISYYHHNRTELDAYLDDWLNHQKVALQAQENDPLIQESRRRFREIRARLARE